jgi:hypothetical protein
MHRPYHHLVSSVVAVSLVAPAMFVGSITSTSVPSVAAAACNGYKNWAVTRTSLPVLAGDGARMAWKPRALVANDTATDGFAAQVLWAGTNGEPVHGDTIRWVEVGTTDGWKGSNVTTFYSAHGAVVNGVRTMYDEYRFTGLTPSATVDTTFTVVSATPSVGFYGKVTANGTTLSKYWTGHSGKTVQYQAGLEVTCSTSRVDRVYVSSSQYRHAPTGAYVTSPSGILDRFTDPPGGPLSGAVAWCTSPKFRYSMNSAIDPAPCN